MVSGIEDREVDDVLGDHHPTLVQSPLDNLAVRTTDQVRPFDHGDDVVAGVPELLGELPRVHLVQQKPHGVEPARISC